MRSPERVLAGPVPHSRPWLGQAEQEAVLDVIRSGQIAQGPVVEALENDWCKLTSKRFAAALGSGVASLRLALIALRVEAGDEVIVPAYSCVALLNAVLSTGATPVLADVELDRWVLSAETVRAVISNKTRAIIAVHLFGMPAPIPELGGFGIPVIEDCAHAIHGRVGNGPIGSAGQLNVSSFYATKLIAGGEGGIIAGDDADMIARVKLARNYSDQPPSPHNLNDKMTDIEAALVRVQLSKSSEIIRRRQILAARYSEFLRPLEQAGLVLLPEANSNRVWYRYAARLLRHRTIDVCAQAQRDSVHVDQPVWDLRPESVWKPGSMTDLAFDTLISLPLYPDLSETEQDLVCKVFSDALEVLPKTEETKR